MPSVEGSNHNFARRLASSDKNTRDKAVALLVLWLSCQQEIGEEDLKKLWKGIFYCVWHSDKAPVQAELIERLAGLLESVDVELSVTFFKVFLSTMRREWGGIDRLRLDKFYLLLRKFLSHMFTNLQTRGWDRELTEKFMAALEGRAFLAIDRFPALGVNLHLLDIFWDELRMCLPIPRGVLELLLEPFYSILFKSSDKSLLKRTRESIFMPLIVEAHSLSEFSDGKQGEDGGCYGLAQVLNSTSVAARLFELASSPATAQGNRKLLYELHEEFSKVAKLLEMSGVALDEGAVAGDSIGESIETAKDMIQEGECGSRTRLRKRQARALALGVKDALSFKPKRSKKSRLTLASSIQDDDQAKVVGSGEHGGSEDALEEGLESERKLTKKKKMSKNAVVTVGMNLQQLEKRFAKRKEKKKKMKSQPAASAGVDVADRFDMNGHIPQGSAGESVASENGHQGIIDVTMNLEKKFDFVAAKIGKASRKISLLSASPLDSSPETRSKRKRKKEKTSGQGLADPVDTPNGFHSGEVVSPVLQPSAKIAGAADKTPDVAVKKSKKVRFSLRNNIVWKPQGPLPPLSVRTPPSATPRGSALKVGVLPGPIRTRPIRATRGTGSTKARKRALKQYVSMTLQKPLRNPSRKVRSRGQTL